MRAIAWLSQDLKGGEISLSQIVKIWGNQCER